MSLFLSICLLHFVAQLSPGPDILLIAKSAASTSRFNALKVVLGISCGIVVWVALTLSGFTLLIEQMPWIQQLIMLVGGGFLAKMGWSMFKGGWLSLRQPTSSEFISIASSASQNYFLSGLFTNLSNPKTLIYFSSVFSLALSSSANSDLKLQLAWVIPLQTFLTFSILMLILSISRIKAIYQRCSAYIDLLSGALFILFAAWLWFDALSLFNAFG